MEIEEIIEIILDTDCNDLTIGDCFEEEEIIELINDLQGNNIIGDEDGFFDDGDIDLIIDNFKQKFNK